MSKLGKLATKPLNRFSPAAILEYVILLPLNAIPIVGTASFIAIQGMMLGCAGEKSGVSDKLDL